MKKILTILLAVATWHAAHSQCAEINAAFTDSVMGSAAYFVDETTTNNGWSVDKRFWDYGDGTYDSVVLQPVHVYALPGNYTVTMTIEGKLPGDSGINELHCTESVTSLVRIISTGINDADGDGLTIYPNPSNGYIQIKKAERVKSVYIYNMSGQLLSQTDNTDGMIELPNNSNYDSYLVRVELESRDVVRRILMVR